MTYTINKNLLKIDSVDIEFTCNAGDAGDGFNPQVGRSLERGYGNPLQYSCLGNFMVGATVHGVTKSWT